MNDSTRHTNAKKSCIDKSKIEELQKVNQAVESQKNESDDLRKLETLFNKLREILRENETIVGKDGLDVISDFLIIRLLNPLLRKNPDNKNAPYIDLLDREYTEKCDKYKKYLEWNELYKLVRKSCNNTHDSGCSSSS